MCAQNVLDDRWIWDSAWTSLGEERVQLFTRGAPRTLYQFWHRCYAEDLWPLVEESAGSGRYLEVGSGRGTTSMYLASRGCDVTLLDYTAHALQLAQRNFLHEGLPRPRVVQADVRATGLRQDSYDVVYSLGLLEHFDDPAPVLREMVRILKPGGWLYAVVIPQRPDGVKSLAYGIFAPWRLPIAWAPARLRRLAKRALRRSDAPEAVPTRSAFAETDYRGILAGEPVTEVRCTAYNPYHEVYSRPAAERLVLVPAYRLHRAMRRCLATSAARTATGIASCLLLTCRKNPRT
jgi:SAM-dependent methyltransferase